MEIGIGALFGLVVLLVLAVVVGAAAVRRMGERKSAIDDPDIETLRYAVPNGQDPTVLVVALTHAHYQARAEPAPHGHDLLVACPPETSRDEIRSVIAGVHSTSLEGGEFDAGRVRFADEQS